MTFEAQTQSIGRAAYSVQEFCTAHGISRATFYNLIHAGAGPRTMKVGRRTLITAQAAGEWRDRMESSPEASR